MIASSRRRTLVLVGAAAALFLAAIGWTAFAFKRFLPPRTVVMTTGPEGSAYRELGEKYRRVLARSGVTLELRPSRGDVENLQRLREAASGVSVGFAASGLTSESESPDVVSLGTVAYYPLWIFCRGLARADLLKELRGKRVAIGQ